MEKREGFVGARLTQAEESKLNRMANTTGRTKSDIVRLLLRQAIVAERPDVQLPEPGQLQQPQEVQHAS